ncbi:MAG: hypothetical protein B7Y74_15985, partial [Novosphingobium sp. 35-62-5]
AGTGWAGVWDPATCGCGCGTGAGRWWRWF